MRLPDFLGIGAVKAGTTWLHHQLCRHPELYLPPIKPVRYFDRHRHKPLEQYAALFAPAGRRVCGEVSASYSTLDDQTLAWLRQELPHLRLILLLREPRARAWSEARMEFAHLRRRPLGSVSEQELCAFLASAPCVAYGDYPAILRAWRSAFPAEQLLVGLYEDIDQRPGELLRGVFRFLGVRDDAPLHPGDLQQRVFAGSPWPIPPRCAALLRAR